MPEPIREEPEYDLNPDDPWSGDHKRHLLEGFIVSAPSLGYRQADGSLGYWLGGGTGATRERLEAFLKQKALQNNTTVGRPLTDEEVVHLRLRAYKRRKDMEAIKKQEERKNLRHTPGPGRIAPL